MNVFDQDQKLYMENVYYTALYKVAKRLDFLLDFCIVKNREKNLVVWPRLYGIKGDPLKWFHAFLSDRSEFIITNGRDSTKMEISCGVPQRSVLGPLLFLIFINDLPKVSNRIRIYLFANDTNI